MLEYQKTEAALKENTRVRQFAPKKVVFWPLWNVSMRVFGVFFVKVVWGHECLYIQHD